MKVLKFGGTSVGSVEALRRVGRIIADGAEGDQSVVVVSAFAGITNQLEDLASRAIQENAEHMVEQIRARHLEVIDELIEDSAQAANLRERVVNLTFQLGELCRGVGLLEELTSRTRARILSAGELLSGAILAAYIESFDVEVAFADSRDYFITSGDPLSGEVLMDQTLERLSAIPGMARVVVMPGFISRDERGFTSTLGRGGSDYTAAIAAAALSANELQIWTDVSGVMTADPRLVPRAHVIESLTYEEAMELSYFGAKVIYPPTMQPLIHARVPLVIKNTYEPDHPGTIIADQTDSEGTIVKGISRIQDISLLTVTGPGMIGVPGTAKRMFDAIARRALNILFITQSSSEHTITVGLLETDASDAEAALRDEFKWELMHGYVDDISRENNLALVAAVGEGMKHRPGVAAKLFGLLGDNGINIRAIAQGSTERNVSFVIETGDSAKALNVLHEGFFLSPVKVAHLFAVGVGNVGAAMLGQLSQQLDALREHHKVEIRLAGLANSKKLAINPDGIDPADWQSALETGEDYSLDTLASQLEQLNLRNSIFVDNTGSSEVAAQYGELLDNNVHVVASNKIAASSEMSNLEKLRATAAKRGVKFLYETNVAAGLPVISTIRDLMLTGDRVHKIEAILSGSLNYIFNNLSADVPLSEAVSQARELGLTEPDPGIDLSGLDVKRKILILAREAGHDLELSDISEGLLVPQGIAPGRAWEDLKSELETNNQSVEAQRLEVEGTGRKWRFVASLDGNEAQVGVVAIDQSHPAWYLEGKDNLVLVYSDRYHEQPLVVKGAGAGPEVTAGGVLADVLRIVNG